MSETTAIAPQTSSSKMLMAMVGIGVLCGLLIVLTYEGTLPRVERLKAEALQRAIFQVVPEITSTKTYAWTGDTFAEPSATSTALVYAGYDDEGQFKGLAIKASGQGYADIISILYGYDPTEQQVVGFYVLESKETPGLGDKIEKDPRFLANFDALDVQLNTNQDGLQNAVVPVKSGEKTQEWEVDGITGATISSRAIANIINASAQEWAPRILAHMEKFKGNNE